MRKSFLLSLAFLALCFVPDSQAQTNACNVTPSPCATLTGILSGANGIPTANAIITLSLSQFATPSGAASEATTYPVNVIYGSQPGKPAANALIYVQTFDKVVNFPANFTGSTGVVGTNPTATATFTLYDQPGTFTNGTCMASGSQVQVGTATISTSGTTTFASTGGTAKTFQLCDTLAVNTPVSQDSTLANVSFTLAGSRAP